MSEPKVVGANVWIEVELEYEDEEYLNDDVPEKLARFDGPDAEKQAREWKERIVGMFA